ncbi:major facilitator superfamily transporter [Fusarium phyllophilum]|uniref:Major facilitator superfamily transporter n=1 Tax=Fusarium phyllophilum TaxID=47803 RepID=A0A8H5JS94_9HYPO|nr:major facilitator superfamily transporter [Fusarium phyllophilum]
MRLARRTSRRPTERLRRETIPISCLDDGIIGWDDQDDKAMPRNFPKSKKWLIVTLLSAITMVTPFASSISSPAMPAINKEFGNTNDMVATLSVTIYLLGYAIGPLFLAPLCETYGRKMILGVANAFFSIFQIGCALAPSITVLIVFRFFAGMGGSGCLV